LLVQDLKTIYFRTALLIRLNQNKIALVATVHPAEKLLNTAKVGYKSQVSHFKDTCMACKLLAMGILPGTEIELIRKAPFGGGCYVKADNILVALREAEAKCIVLRS
jgi:ferrous iron transport protein A